MGEKICVCVSGVFFNPFVLQRILNLVALWWLWRPVRMPCVCLDIIRHIISFDLYVFVHAVNIPSVCLPFLNVVHHLLFFSPTDYLASPNSLICD